MKTIQIQIQPGSDTSTFDIYTDSDSYTTPIHYNVTKSELEIGYTSTIVPDNATIIKVSSNSVICPDQYILIPITTTTTTTTTTESNNLKTIFPSYDGTWIRSTSETFPVCRNYASSTTLYDNISYSTGNIVSNESTTPPILSTIGRYYMKINISDIISEGITQSNISTISLRAYLYSTTPITTPITLDLFEAGTSLISSTSRYRSYIQNTTLISYPNIKISSITMINNGFYTFNLNAYGLSVINQRIQNNEDIVLSIVTYNDSENISPSYRTPPISITFKSILESDVNKYPRLYFTIV